MSVFRIAVLAIVCYASSLAGDEHIVRSPQQTSHRIESLAPKHQAVLRAVYRDMFTYVPPPSATGSTSSATFAVTYNGFTPQAQTAFQHAVNIWSALLVSPVTIRVTANWSALPPGVLGSAAAGALYRDFSGAPQAGTWYAVALAEKLAGVDINLTTEADINASFSSAFPNWYFGTDGNTPAGQFDFVSVVLHELCHGLTFAGSMTVSGGQGSWGSGSGFPFIFDRFAENGAGQSLINTGLFPNPSAALATQLQSNSVFFDAPQAVVANGGTRPPLYAPASWIQGSSYSHLNESSYPPGNQNSLMTPEIGMAEAIHAPGPVTLAMFRDMGWTTGGGGGGSNIKYEERFTSTVIPAGWRVVDNDGGGVPLSFRQLIAFTGGDTVRPQAGTSFWFGSFNGANGSGRIDEWLIGPRINGIIAGDSLYFYAGAIGGQFADSIRVFISTTDSNRASFTTQIGYFKVPGPTGSWHLFGFNLTPFAGSHIFFAVNYFIVDGGPTGTHSDNVWIDHFVITTDATVAVEEQGNGIPSKYALEQNYPNPFNPTTSINFQIPTAGFVTLKVFDVLGREVASLVNQERTAGSHTARFDAATLSSGVYYYKLNAGSFSETRRLMLVK